MSCGAHRFPNTESVRLQAKKAMKERLRTGQHDHYLATQQHSVSLPPPASSYAEVGLVFLLKRSSSTLSLPLRAIRKLQASLQIYSGVFLAFICLSSACCCPNSEFLNFWLPHVPARGGRSLLASSSSTVQRIKIRSLRVERFQGKEYEKVNEARYIVVTTRE